MPGIACVAVADSITHPDVLIIRIAYDPVCGDEDTALPAEFNAGMDFPEFSGCLISRFIALMTGLGYMLILLLRAAAARLPPHSGANDELACSAKATHIAGQVENMHNPRNLP
jgi:hypothetical protein